MAISKRRWTQILNKKWGVFQKILGHVCGSAEFSNYRRVVGRLWAKKAGRKIMERSIRYQRNAPLVGNRPLRSHSTDAPLQHNGAFVNGQLMLRFAARCRWLSRFRVSIGVLRAAFSVATERSFVCCLCLKGLQSLPDSTTTSPQNAVFRAKTHFPFVLIFHSYLDFRSSGSVFILLT